MILHLQLGEALPSGGFAVVAPFAGSPAEEVRFQNPVVFRSRCYSIFFSALLSHVLVFLYQAGILAGEQVLSIDGIRLNLLTKREVTTLLRGPSGSVVSCSAALTSTGHNYKRMLLKL